MAIRLSFYFLFPLILTLLSQWLIGVNLGGAFAIIAVITIITPIAAASARERGPALLAAILTTLSATAAAFTLLWHDTFNGLQVFAIMATAFSLGFALAVLVRLLITLHVAPILAGAIITLLAIAWLSWPVWMSSWLTFQNSDAIAARMTAIHPLLAINAIAPQFGFWTQSHYLYQLTTLGQDVTFTLPASVWPCVGFQLLIALLGLSPVAVREWRRGATPESPKADHRSAAR